MKKTEITDEMLYRYMPLVDEIIIDSIEADTDRTHKFSSEFEERMEKVMKDTKRCRNKKRKIVWKVAAAFFVCLIGTWIIFTVSTQAYRIAFFETIKTFLEDSVLCNYQTNEMENNLVHSEPVYIPKGFEEIERVENVISTVVIYQNEKNESIIWEKKAATEDRVHIMDSKYELKKQKKINGCEVMIYVDENQNKLVYYEQGQDIFTITAPNIENKELFRMCSSMLNEKRKSERNTLTEK